MLKRCLLFVVSLIAGSALFAQERTLQRPPELQLPSFEIEPAHAATTAVEPETSVSALSRPGEPVAHETGETGDVILDGTAKPGFGVFLHAKTAGAPYAGVKLGSTASRFAVFDSSDFEYFSANSGGSLTFRKDHNGPTAFEINNANPGSTGVGAWTALRFMEGTSVKSSITVVGSGWTDLGPNALRILNAINAPIVLGTNNLERARIGGEGNVAIGTTNTANARLRVAATSGWSFIAGNDHTITADSATNFFSGYVSARQHVPAGVTNMGSVIGQQMISLNAGQGRVQQTIASWIDSGVESTGIVDSAYGAVINIVRNSGTVTTGFGVYLPDLQATTGYAIFQIGADDRNYFAGNGGIGTMPTANALEVNGNAYFNGTVSGVNIKANYQDLAEWVPATTDMSPGTVVVLNPGRSNEVMPSGRSYDTAVAGVVSAQPGIILGVDGPSKEQIATTGRVRVRVDATAAPIRIGDLLVTSDKPGIAMRSMPVDVQGIAMHRPGTVLGKALEPLGQGEGEILVLLSLQ